MKMSRACSGMSSSENDFKFLKTAKKHKMHVHQGHHSSRGRVTVLSLKIRFVVDHERSSSQRAVLYIFQNIEILMLVTFH